MSRGYVYILINGLMPDVLKVGMTTLHPNERAKQLRTTGVPVHFTVAYYEQFDDCEYAERKMHDCLKNYRTSSDREFFSCPLKVAINFLQELKLSQPDDHNLDTVKSDTNSDSYIEGEINQLFTPTEVLSQIVGIEPITKENAMSRIWEYIKHNRLQNPENRREIQCDNIIKSPHGLDKINIFELAGWLTKNLKS